MSSPLIKHKELLSLLSRVPKPTRRSILKYAPNGLIDCMSECCLNILKGNVRLTLAQKRKLARHKHQLRQLSKRGVSVTKRKKIVQSGGFLPLLPLIAKIAGGVLPGLLGAAL